MSEDSFVRWQGRTVEQFGYALNLVLGMSLATLGFGIAIVLDKKLSPVCWEKAAIGGSLVLLVASIGLGLFCVLNRLRDFRTTMKIARLRSRPQSVNSAKKMAQQRTLSRTLGKRTWRVFRGQIVTFFLAVLLLGSAIAAQMVRELL